MNLKKIIFLIAIILFIIGFKAIFGSENSLIGVMVLFLALMMLTQDLTKHPITNFFVISAITVVTAIFTYISSLFVGVGFFINLILAFFIVFTTMHDLKRPVTLPYLLCFAFLLSAPVSSLDGLYIRIIALIIGSFFVVMANIVINKKRFHSNPNEEIIALIDKVIECCFEKINLGKINEESLIASSNLINQRIYNSLKKNYFSTPSNRSLLNITTAIKQIGLIISRDEISEKHLNELIKTLTNLKNGEIEKFNSYINESELVYSILSNLKIIKYELKQNNSNNPYGEVPSSFKIKTILKSNFNFNSIKFVFALKIAIIIAFFNFIAVYFNLPMARWLIFTGVVTTTPYVDLLKDKPKRRIIGTLVGVFLFIAFYYIIFGELIIHGIDNILISEIIIILLAYIYTTIGVKGFDIQIICITLLCLTMANTTIPPSGFITERIICVTVATIVCTALNYLVWPYSLYEENKEMVLTYNQLNIAEINNLKNTIENNSDDVKTAALRVKSSLLEDKIRKNNEIDENRTIDEIIDIQSTMSEYSLFLTNTLKIEDISTNTKKIAILLLNKTSNIPKDNIPTQDKSFLMGISNLVQLQEESLKKIANLT